MRNVFLLFLISIFAASLALPQSATAPKKSTTTVKKAVTAKKTSAKTIPRSSSAKKGKSTKKAVRTASAEPYRQATPTPERYREIQQALVDKGYLKSEPNGVWDAQSVDALTRFQNDKKLTPTGKITSTSLINLGLGPKNDAQKPLEMAPKPAEPTPASVPAPENP
jgi:hypothetical protein